MLNALPIGPVLARVLPVGKPREGLGLVEGLPEFKVPIAGQVRARPKTVFNELPGESRKGREKPAPFG